MTKNEQEKEATPGVFVSTLADYPGSFTLPAPFLDQHMRVWWDVAIAPAKKMDAADFDFYHVEWQGVVKLIMDFGFWNIDSVPRGDLDNGNVPAAVKKWVLQVSGEYIYPFLPPRMLARVFGNM